MRLVRAGFFVCLTLVFLLTSCSSKPGRSLSSNSPVRIIYPEQGSTISNDWLLLVVKTDGNIYDTEVLVDGRKPEDINRKDILRTTVFAFRVNHGKHRVEVVGYGKDIEKVKSLYKKYNGTPSDIYKLEKALKGVPVRRYSEVVEIEVKEPGPMKLKPIDQGKYYEILNAAYEATAGLKPVATAKRTSLVRTKRGLTEMYWVVPKADKQKAEVVLESRPHLEITYQGETSEPAIVQSCYGSNRDVYTLALDIARDNRLALYYLDEHGEKTTLSVSWDDVIKKAFEERIVPGTWWKEEAFIMRWKDASVLPDPARAMLCSESTVVVPVSFHCVYVKCSPSVVPGYLVVYRDGTYEVYISDKNKIEGYSWRGSEVIVPVGQKAAVLDLATATYRMLGQQKQYHLPLLVRLPGRLSRQFYFQRNVLRPESDATMVSQQLNGSGNTVYGLVEMGFSYRVVLKQTLIFVAHSQGGSVSEEVPIYYAIEGTD